MASGNSRPGMEACRAGVAPPGGGDFPAGHGTTMGCQHCKRPVAVDRRNLCWKCYKQPSVRNKYRKLPAVKAGIGWQIKKRPLPKEPTATVPGTPERIAVLCERAEREEQIWHPDDVTT